MMKNLRKVFEKHPLSFLKHVQSNEVLMEELFDCTYFLNEHYENPTIKQRIFHITHNILDTVKCVHCGKPTNWNTFDAINYSNFYYPSKNYQEYCDNSECQHAKNSNKIKKQWAKKGITNISQLPKWKETKIKNCLEQHGTEWYSQTTEFKNKVRETSIKEYGVEHFTQNENVQKRKVETCLEKYGKEHVSQVEEIKQKKKETCLKNYGVEAPLQNKEIQEKTKQTNTQKYGTEWVLQSEMFKIKSQKTYNKLCVEHCSQLTGVIEKRSRAGYRWRDYVLPSGKNIKAQGYENFAIDYLLKTYSEDDLIIDNLEIENFIGKIWYVYKDKTHRYFPDIYIKSIDTVIEVKSEWTFNNQKKLNLIKAKKVMEQRNFQFLIMNKDQVFSQFIPDI